MFLVFGLCLLLDWVLALLGCVVFGCLARISVVTPFNSIKVTCAFRHTQRLQPCKKRRCQVQRRHQNLSTSQDTNTNSSSQDSTTTKDTTSVPTNESTAAGQDDERPRSVHLSYGGQVKVGKVVTSAQGRIAKDGLSLNPSVMKRSLPSRTAYMHYWSRGRSVCKVWLKRNPRNCSAWRTPASQHVTIWRKSTIVVARLPCFLWV